MADRYWVGGTGTWDATSTANWSTATGKSITASCATTTLTVTAGTVVVGDTVWSNNHTSLGTITADLGGGDWTVSIGGTFASQAMSAATVGASAPTAVDSVFFDANSNSGTTAFTVTVSAALCNDFNAPGTSTALDGAMTLAMASSTLTVSGSWTNQATNFSVTNTAGTLTFNATTTGKTITTNGVTIGVNTTLNGVGGAWTLGSAFSCGSGTLTLTNGTFNTSTSNYSVTCFAFSSSNSNTRTITLNGSTITVTATFAWDMATSTNATLNAGTSTIVFSATAVNFDGGGLTYYNVSFTDTSALAATKTITGANTFNNLTFSTISSAGLNNIVISANQTINGTLTVNGSSGNRRMFVRSSAIGTSRTLTCAAIAAMTDVDFRDITIAGAAGTLSGTRLGDCGGNSNITFVAGKTVYWSLVGGGNWNDNGWAPGSGGTPATTEYPLPQDTAIIENTGLNTSATITINGAWNIGTLDASTRTNAMTLASSTLLPTFYGNFTYGSGVTPTGTGTYTFSNRSTKTLNSGGKTFTQPVTIDAPGGGIQLLTNNLTLGSTLTTVLTRGTLSLNNLTLTTGLFSSNNSNTRTIAFGTTGQITLTGNATTVWNTGTTTGFSSTGTFLVVSNYSGSAGTRTFSLGGLAVDFKAGSASGGISFGTTGTDIVSVSGSAIRDIDTSSFTGTFGNATRMLTGNLTIGAGTTVAAGTSTTTFGATSGTQLITTNGKTLDFPITFNSTGATCQLQDALTVGTTRTATLSSGSLDLNNLTLSTGLFLSNINSTRSIAFGSTGSIVLTTTVGGTTTLDMATATNFTFTGTSNISTAMSVSRTFNFGGTAGATAANRLNINLTSNLQVPTFTGSFRQINFTGSTCNPGNVNISCHGFTLASGGTYTTTDFTTIGDGTLTSNGRTIDSLTINGVGITSTLQDALIISTLNSTVLTAGTLDLNNFTLSTGGFSSNNSNTRSIAFGSTGSIVLTTTLSGATVLSMATATNFTFTGASNISAAMSVTRTFNFGGTAGATTSNRLNINLTSGASTPTFTGSFRQINFTGSTSNPGAQTISCHGFTLASGGTYTTTSFTTVGDGTLTYTGKSISTLNVNTAGITTTLADAGQNATTTLTNGTLNLAGFTLTSTTTAATATGTKNLTFNGGTLVCSAASTTAWNNAQPTNFTTTAGTGTGTISMTAATAKTFVGGGSTYNCTLNQGGAGTLTITGANTFNDITETVPTANQITFPASTTTTVNSFTLSGSSGNLVSLRSSTPGTQFTLSDPSGTVSVSYLNIQDSNATGGAIWLSPTTSGNVDNGNNLGWTFGTLYTPNVDESATAVDATDATQFFAGLISESATAADSQTTQLDAVAFVNEVGPITQSTFTLPLGTSFTGSTIFNSSSAGGGLAVVANGTGTGASGGFAAGGNYVLFSGGNTRSIATIPLDLISYPSFSFSIIRGNDSNGGETPDTNENIVVEYSINGGSSYTTIATILNTDPITAFTTLSYSMPVGAQTASTIIRWRQATSSSSGNDQYGIRNFTFDGNGGAGASDAVNRQIDAVGAVSETTRGSDTTIGRLTRIGSINEQAQGNDAISSRLICTSAVVEQVRGSDAIVLTLTRVGAISETARGSDSDVVTLTTSGLISESATGVDTIDSQRDTFGIIDEQATAVDTTVVNASLQLFVNQTATITDAPTNNLIATLQISEGATILDAALARLLWELINDNQLPGWQLIPNNQGSGWTIINNNTGTSWTDIDTV